MKATHYYLIILFIILSVMLLSANKADASGISINLGDGSASDISIDGGVAQSGNISIDGGVVSSGSGGCGSGIEGNGIDKKEKRAVSEFKSVEIDGAFNVYIECQKKKSIEVRGDSNILPHIITRVVGSTLQITSNKTICPKRLLEVRVSVDNVEKISASGAVDLLISGVNNNGLDVEVDGAVDVKASGKTKNLKLDVSGAGDIKAKELKAENVDVIVNGAGNAVVNVSKKLKAEINGAGDITYYGNPKEVVKDVSGVGDIIKK
ncbi:MAG: head GIN domain-containing protein [Pseudomonadota bacterium]